MSTAQIQMVHELADLVAESGWAGMQYGSDPSRLATLRNRARTLEGAAIHPTIYAAVPYAIATTG